MKMSLNQALLIQRAQLVYYRRLIGRSGIKDIRKNTKIPVGIDPNTNIFIGTINEYIPRGGSFEYLIKNNPKTIDQNDIHYHNAIKNGKEWV